MRKERAVAPVSAVAASINTQAANPRLQNVDYAWQCFNQSGNLVSMGHEHPPQLLPLPQTNPADWLGTTAADSITWLPLLPLLLLLRLLLLPPHPALLLLLHLCCTCCCCCTRRCCTRRCTCYCCTCRCTCCCLLSGPSHCQRSRLAPCRCRWRRHGQRQRGLEDGAGVAVGVQVVQDEQPGTGGYPRLSQGAVRNKGWGGGCTERGSRGRGLR